MKGKLEKHNLAPRTSARTLRLDEPLFEGTPDPKLPDEDWVTALWKVVEPALEARDLPVDPERFVLTKHDPTPPFRAFFFGYRVGELRVWGVTLTCQVSMSGRLSQIDLSDTAVLTAKLAETSGNDIGEKAAIRAVEERAGIEKLRSEPRARRVLYRVRRALVEAYRVTVPGAVPFGDFAAIVDAESGKMLEGPFDQASYVGAKVFAPNPIARNGVVTLRNPSALSTCGFAGTPRATIAGYLSGPVSPVVDVPVGVALSSTAVRVVQAPAVSTGPIVDIVLSGDPLLYYADTQASSDPEVHRRFEAVMVYHHITRFRASLSAPDGYGIDIPAAIGTASGWFDGIRADPKIRTPGGASDTGVYRSAFTPGDAGQGRVCLRFGMGDDEGCFPHRAQDADDILHEYVHAVQAAHQSDSLASDPGHQPVGVDDGERKAFEEGLADLIACLHSVDAVWPPHQPWIFADWLNYGTDPSGSVHFTGMRDLHDAKDYGTVTGWTGAAYSHDLSLHWSATFWAAFEATGALSQTTADLARDVRRAWVRAMLKTSVLNIDVGAPGLHTMQAAARQVLVNHVADENQNPGGSPPTTPYLGKYLLPLLDAFHARRLLPVDPAADVYLRDYGPEGLLPEDMGDDVDAASPSRPFYDSPDVWVQNSEGALADAPHQEPLPFQDNWFFARIRNRGTAPARVFGVTFNVVVPSTELVYPESFIEPFISAAVGFDLQPGTPQIVRAKWPSALVPEPGAHRCILVTAYAATEKANLPGRHVWERGNLAQKNVNVVNVGANMGASLGFRMGSRWNQERRVARLEIRRSKGWEHLGITLHHRDPALIQRLATTVEPIRRPRPAGPSIRFPKKTTIELLDASGHGTRLSLAAGSRIDVQSLGAPPRAPSRRLFERQVDVVEDKKRPFLRFREGRTAGLPVPLGPRAELLLHLGIEAPPDAKPGSRIPFDVVQIGEDGRLVGGIRVIVVVS